MILEQRDYRLVLGGVPRYLAAWHERGRDPQIRHLGEPAGLYTAEIGELNTLVYLWRFTDFEDRARRRAALAQDRDFTAFRGQVRELLVSQSNRILLPAELPGGETPP
jgi:hypothetical protein